jgi:uncharacterized phiE125 gp8 family phage protein
MILVEQAAVPVGALPVQGLADHLRLGTGFADDAVQDALLENYLRAAIAAVEGRIGKALIVRRFVLTLTAWGGGVAGQALPMAPVQTVVEVVLRSASGIDTVVDPARWRLRPDQHRPRLSPRGAALPMIPEGGLARVVFDAGFGASWAEVPPDLQQAVLMLAAHFHEFRHEQGVREQPMPFGIMALIERWRTVRVLGGGGR